MQSTERRAFRGELINTILLQPCITVDLVDLTVSIIISVMIESISLMVTLRKGQNLHLILVMAAIMVLKQGQWKTVEVPLNTQIVF